jgi:hypothetical protein
VFSLISLSKSGAVVGRRGRDRMGVGFTTTYAISGYRHWCCEYESRSGRGVQQYVIKFVSDLRQVGGFLRVLRYPPPIKLIDAIYLKYWWVSLNTIKQTIKQILNKSTVEFVSFWTQVTYSHACKYNMNIIIEFIDFHFAQAYNW